MRENIEVVGATLPFVKYEIDGIRYFEFDSSHAFAPEPMVNATRGLNLLENEHDVLVMINAQEPTPFFARIEKDYSWVVEELDNGDVKIFFKRRF